MRAVGSFRVPGLSPFEMCTIGLIIMYTTRDQPYDSRLRISTMDLHAFNVFFFSTVRRSSTKTPLFASATMDRFDPRDQRTLSDEALRSWES